MYIDLHIHSTASDGTLTPRQIIQQAFEIVPIRQQILIALTDHDTTAGIPEFLQEAHRLQQEIPDASITAIPGVEISAEYHGQEVHILGYGIDPHEEHLCAVLKQCRESRDGRNEKMIEKLNEYGFSLSLADIIAKNPDATIARPHIARALLEHGYVASIQEAFDRYLAKGRPCYVERVKPSASEAIQLIKQAGGIAVLAHIMLYKKLTLEQKNELVSQLKKDGLVGIETYYNTYSQEEITYVSSLAKQYDLFKTGGTDFHGDNKPHIRLFSGQGTMRVPDHISEILNYM